jgi:hypothetical protein
MGSQSQLKKLAKHIYHLKCTGEGGCGFCDQELTSQIRAPSTENRILVFQPSAKIMDVCECPNLRLTETFSKIGYILPDHSETFGQHMYFRHARLRNARKIEMFVNSDVAVRWAEQESS